VFSLKGKCAVVTGGGRGIGRGISRAMAQAGATVVITGRSEQPLAETVGEIEKAGGKAVYIPGDICSFNTINAVVKKALDTGGYIDCWVNNAGSADPKDNGPAIDMSEAAYDRVVGLNAKWAFFAAQAAARTMTRGGSIINISSRAGHGPSPLLIHYSSAKAALNSMTMTLAAEWGHKNIRVNAISPGVVRTERDEQTAMTSGGRIKRQLDTVPLRRLGKVEDVAHLCVYFASDEAEWVSGQVIQVTGGSPVPMGLMTYLWKVNNPEAVAAKAKGKGSE
jgi:NAD(P)-dependent dehydrogenase (short-subunit alcohol dehydrogenase family)